MMVALHTLHTLKALLRDPIHFIESTGSIRLREYQCSPMLAILRSVIGRKGLSFVVMFPRQSGKNELQAQLECYLLALLSQTQAEMVKISPTWKPQSLNAMRRLERVLQQNKITQRMWHKESGYIYRVGLARMLFFSGAPEANIVGATAGTLLEVDEAQDVSIAKFDKDIAPMAASTNATRVFWGTAWTSRTLLARELRVARQAEQADGVQRAFVLTAREVALEVEAYGRFVEEQTTRLGRDHPLVKTQFYSEEIDAEGGMFPPARRDVMRGMDPCCGQPQPGRMYAMLLDVAGEDESASADSSGLAGRRRDSTALTIVEVDLATLQDDLLRAPTYRCVHRRLWTGVKHTALYGQLHGLIETWQPQVVVMDATGVGAGLASFLQKRFPTKILPFLFNHVSKSKLGWDFLSVCDSGRWLEPDTNGIDDQSALQTLFWRQVEACQYQVADSPGRLMKWGVPDGSRDPLTGEFMHDDLVISAALAAVLDTCAWYDPTPALVVHGQDPLFELDRGEF
jgi:hypothetical protein